MSDRKLATLRRIKELLPIPNADRIEVAVVDGWKVVVQKGLYKVGDLVVYLEIDSWVPSDIAPFLTKEGKEAKEYKGIKGERLRTVKLRGQISQGLILPIKEVLPLNDEDYSLQEGANLTASLGIIKWEAPEKEYKGPGNVSYTCKVFPTNLFPKTDQERVQNCYHSLPKNHTWEVTVKLDGSSCSIFKHQGRLRVCSRNLEIEIVKEDPSWWGKLLGYLGLRKLKSKNTDNQFVKAALENSNIPEGYCAQGELCGPSIQNNYEKLDNNKFFVYDVVDLSTRKYLDPEARRKFCERNNLAHVPVIDAYARLPESVEATLNLAETVKGMNRPDPEGVVFKSNEDPSVSFKAISNKYLLKEE